jgi:hypothetical protein
MAAAGRYQRLWFFIGPIFAGFEDFASGRASWIKYGVS